MRRAAREARRLGRTRLTAEVQPAPLAGCERRAPSVRPQEPEDRLHLGIDRPIRSQDTVLLAAHDVDRRVRVECAVNGSWITGGAIAAAVRNVASVARMPVIVSVGSL